MKVKFLNHSERLTLLILALIVIFLLGWGYFLQAEGEPYNWQKKVGYGILSASIILIVTYIVNYYNLKNRQKIKIVKGDYEKNIEAIQKYIKWLVEEEEACDFVTLYTLDKVIEGEYNLVAYEGLKDTSPMFGPVVYDDFRKTLDGKGEEHWELIIPPIEETNENQENSGGFRTREGVQSRVTFIQRKDQNVPDKALYFNWRSSKEHYNEAKRKQKKEYAQIILDAFKKIGTSQRMKESSDVRNRLFEQVNKEMLNRLGNISSNKEIITKYIYKYFDAEEFSRGELRIMLLEKLNGTYRLIFGKNYEEKTLSTIDNYNNQAPNFDWVLSTTRSKFIIDNEDSGGQIIIPIRKLPFEQKSAFGLISIECRHSGKLKEDMVKNLYLLADQFGSRMDF